VPPAQLLAKVYKLNAEFLQITLLAGIARAGVVGEELGQVAQLAQTLLHIWSGDADELGPFGFWLSRASGRRLWNGRRGSPADDKLV
jgi:hypothetical protein